MAWSCCSDWEAFAFSYVVIASIVCAVVVPRLFRARSGALEQDAAQVAAQPSRKNSSVQGDDVARDPEAAAPLLQDGGSEVSVAIGTRARHS